MTRELMLNVSALKNRTPKIYLDDVNFGVLLEKAGFNTGKNSFYYIPYFT